MLNIDNGNLILERRRYLPNQHLEISTVRHIKVKVHKSSDCDWTYWNSRIAKHPGVKKEVVTLIKSQKNKYVFCGLNFRPTV